MHQLGWHAVVAVSSLLIAVAFLLYPAVLIAAARLFGRPTIREELTPSVTILLPVRNGGPWIQAKLESIRNLNYPPEKLHVIVISDGSTDQTSGIARSCNLPRLLVHEMARAGKWAAINRGLELASGEVVLFTDVRQMLHPESLRRMTSRLADSQIGVVSGELMIRAPQGEVESPMGLYWRYEKAIRKAQSALGSATGATGAIYLMRRELSRPLPPHCLDDDVYLPLQSVFQGKRVVFEEGAYAHDDPTHLDKEFSRKVRTLAGLYQMLGFLPKLWIPGNGIWLHFWLHKMTRLATPFAFAAIALSSIALIATPFGLALVVCQAVCYGTAMMDSYLPAGGFAKRISSTLRAFVVMQVAALMACSILFRSAADFWTDVHQPRS